jgi:hypothetical protein
VIIAQVLSLEIKYRALFSFEKGANLRSAKLQLESYSTHLSEPFPDKYRALTQLIEEVFLDKFLEPFCAIEVEWKSPHISAPDKSERE